MLLKETTVTEVWRQKKFEFCERLIDFVCNVLSVNVDYLNATS